MSTNPGAKVPQGAWNAISSSVSPAPRLPGRSASPWRTVRVRLCGATRYSCNSKCRNAGTSRRSGSSTGAVRRSRPSAVKEAVARPEASIAAMISSAAVASGTLPARLTSVRPDAVTSGSTARSERSTPPVIAMSPVISAGRAAWPSASLSAVPKRISRASPPIDGSMTRRLDAPTLGEVSASRPPSSVATVAPSAVLIVSTSVDNGTAAASSTSAARSIGTASPPSTDRRRKRVTDRSTPPLRSSGPTMRAGVAAAPR